MPSLRWNLGVGTLMALILAYSVVVAQEVLLGIFGATLVFLVAWLALEASRSPELPFPRGRTLAIGVALSVLILAYSVVAQAVLFGIIAAVVVFLACWGLTVLSHFGYTPSLSLSRSRYVGVVVLSVLVILYSLLVTQQFLLGVLTAALVYFAAWLTDPRGPIRGGRGPDEFDE